MTAPDLLDILVARYPAMVAYQETEAGDWAVEITDPDMGERWHVGATTRQGITGAALAWERHRASVRNGPRRCKCGSLYGEHAWDAAGKRKGACPRGEGRYEPQALAALAGRPS